VNFFGDRLCLFCGLEHSPHCEWKQFPKLHGVYSSFVYEGGVKDWILSIKERRQPERWRELKKTDLPDFQLKPTALVAVPSDPRQRSERFFDSAEILAARISTLLSIPVLDLFSRDPFISSQKEMSRTDRLKWLRKCLHLRQPQPSVKRLLLIDDVMTSGASILRCLELIHDRCESLAVYSVARTLARTGQIKDK
jgi:predicted amidophosphoribosyltransferase